CHYEKAQALYERLLEADPESDLVAGELAQLLQAAGRLVPARQWWEKVLPVRARAVAQRPDDRQAWKDLGIVRAELGQPDAAAAAFAKLMDLTPQSWDEVLWYSPDPAGIGEALARYDEVFVQLVQMRPRDRTLLIARFHHLGRRGRWKEAAEMAARIIELDPKDAHARNYQRALLVYLGDLEGYRRACREDEARLVAEGQDPADDECQGQYQSTGFSLLLDGIRDYRQGQFAGAVRQLVQVPARTKHPYSLTLADLFLAMAHQRLGQPAEARRELDAARTRLAALGRVFAHGVGDVVEGVI